MPGYSAVAGLSRCANVWNEYLAPINGLNIDIGGDHVEDVLWWAINLPLPLSVKNVVILCRTNNTNNIIIVTPHDIANCIISIGSLFQNKSSGINVSVCGLIPVDECWLVNRIYSFFLNRILINEVNEILKYKCNINGFTFIFQVHRWTFANGSLDCSLFNIGFLYLIEQGNVKLAKSITLAITSWYNHFNLSSTNSSTSCTDTARQKVQSTISFLLNEHDLPPLFNFCQPILPNVIESCLYQCKSANNVKLVNLHVSPIYASTVSKILELLSISKHVCSTKAT